MKIDKKQYRNEMVKLRKQELQSQKYFISQLFNFIQLRQGNSILSFLVTKRIQRFDMFDNVDSIITTLGSGVYIFFRDRKIKYIGSSKEMRTRIKRHTRKNAIRERKYKPGDRIITIGTMTEKEARQLEGQLILQIQPPRNKKKTWGGIYAEEYDEDKLNDI